MKTGVTVRLVWRKGFVQKMDAAMCKGGALQKYLDMIVLEGVSAYMPKDTGMLEKSGVMHTKIGSGKIIWKTPYARYLYHGMLMVDPITGKGSFYDAQSGRHWSRRGVAKVLTDRPLMFKGGGKRGAKWPERWKKDNMRQVKKALTIKARELAK